MATASLLPSGDVVRRELAQIARIVIVAAVAWAVCVALGADYPPVFAVVVPLVSLRDDPFSAFNVSLARLVGVVVGLAIGIGIVQLLQPGLLAMCVVVALGLLVGMVLRIGGPMNVQVAVTALLVFSSPDVGGYGWERLWETGIGTAATVLLAPFLFPANPLSAARREIADIADGLLANLRETVEIAGAGAALDADQVHRLQATIDRIGDLRDAVRALGGQIATARTSAPWSVLRRRELRAVAGLDPVRGLARELADGIGEFAEEVIAFGGRTEYPAEPYLRYAELRTVSDPLGAATQTALDGRSFDDELARAESAIDSFRATEHSHMASVVRRPLHRMVEDLRRFADARADVSDAARSS